MAEHLIECDDHDTAQQIIIDGLKRQYDDRLLLPIPRLKTNNPEQLEKALRQQIKNVGDRPLLWSTLGQSLMKHGEWQEAFVGIQRIDKLQQLRFAGGFREVIRAGDEPDFFTSLAFACDINLRCRVTTHQHNGQSWCPQSGCNTRLMFIFIALQRGLTVLWENRQSSPVTRVNIAQQ